MLKDKVGVKAASGVENVCYRLIKWHHLSLKYNNLWQQRAVDIMLVITGY